MLLEEFIEAIEAQVNRKEKQDNRFLKGEGVGSFFLHPFLIKDVVSREFRKKAGLDDK